MKDYRLRLYERYVSSHVGEVSQGRSQSRDPLYKRIIKKHFPADKDDAPILELGCGHGAFIRKMSEYGYTNIQGVDFSSEQVDIAKKFGISNVRQKDLMQELEESANNTYDLIIAIDVIEHFNKMELLKLLDKINLVLNEGVHSLLATATLTKRKTGSSRP
ncbi:class I SAM-dependent methyltransferase [Desulfohalobium retbaense]|uniref:class I SAM-dependent methyltransferase n=1 Tax=Desulfohalobium retbaense TaxID=45663 RepID=UPI0009FFC5DF|nr:class I SAM-dependent methyltransferase [Desulfohalobium retbaense]